MAPVSASDERARLDALATPLLARAATPYIALSGTANVVMQLSQPPVGYGVKDSQAPSALFADPARRRRTTVAYLAVAAKGTAAERAAFRRATNASHAAVRSAPGAQPAYSAFDPDLQLWVAACLYRGFEEASEAVWGPLAADREAFYQQGVVLGGMLQLPAAMWPADRGAFETYWRDALGHARIDDAVRAYLLRVIRLEYLGRRVPGPVLERRFLLVTGFLPPELRDQMRLAWSADDERRFRRLTGRAAAVIRRGPERLRGFPFDRALADVRRRMAADEPLF